MEMGEWMKVLLSMTLSGTLLLVFLLALKRVCRTRVSKCWQYYILLAAALRFLVPFTSDAALVGRLFVVVQNAAAQQERTKNDSMANADNAVYADKSVKTGNGMAEDSQTVQNGYFAVSGSGISQPAIEFWTYAFFVWLAIALMFFMRKVTIYQSFLRYIKAGNQELADLETLNLLAGCAENLHVKRTIGLYKNPLIASPMAVGFFHPCIILPKREAGVQELSYIFTHELTHLKRWDLVYKWVVQVTVCVHWFNPFAYLLEREVTRACELSCDEAVIRSLDEVEKKAYGDTLLLFLKTDDAYKSLPASVTLTQGAKALKERLGAIMGFRKKSKAVTAVTVALTALVCICFQSLGVYAMQGRTQRTALEEKVAEEKLLKEEPVDEALAEEQLPQEKPSEAGEYTYVQSGYYEKPFMIVLTYCTSTRNIRNFLMNWGEEPDAAYQRQVTLTDGSKMTVYFMEEAEQLCQEHPEAYSAVGTVIHRLNAQDADMQVRTALVRRIDYVQEDRVADYVRECYRKEDIIGFSNLFSALEETEKAGYYDKIYNAEQVAFFSVAADEMNAEQIALYADKAYEDDKVAFFSILCDRMDKEHIQTFAKRSYEQGDIAKFSIVVSDLTREEKKEWLLRAQLDKRVSFAAVLEDSLEDFDDYDAFDSFDAFDIYNF